MKENQNPETMLDLGAWLGRHQAFGTIANRCSAADAECLKTIRDRGDYKQLGLSWEQFCEKHVGVSRQTVDRQIQQLEEFGPSYHRFAEVMSISPATYRLIQSSVTDAGLECEGETIPLTRENRARLSAAVAKAKSRSRTGVKTVPGLRKRLDALVADVQGIANQAESRLELLVLLNEGGQILSRLAETMRLKTLVR